MGTKLAISGSHMQAHLSQEEQAQILQTIEMFEVITQTQPDDYQSFDILKEAYLKLGRLDEAHTVSRKLADAYLAAGLYSSALLECEGILSRSPDAADVVALMGEIEAKMNAGGRNQLDRQLDGNGGSNERSTLVATNTTRKEHARRGSDSDEPEDLLVEDGNEALAKFLVYQNLAAEDSVTTALETVRHKNHEADGGIAHSLLAEIAMKTGAAMPDLISGILDATKFAYIPIEIYEVDRQIVKMLPDKLTLGRLMVPFDIVSRTIMIALCNPFDGPAKETAQNMLEYNIQWYLASPEALMRVLRDVYKV